MAEAPHVSRSPRLPSTSSSPPHALLSTLHSLHPIVTPGPPRPDLVARLLTEASLLSREARAAAARAAAAAPAARGEGDTGSSQVQVAILTHRIASLSAHLQTHRKDHSSRR